MNRTGRPLAKSTDVKHRSNVSEHRPSAADPYLSAPIVRYSSGRIPWARAVLLERGGHVLVGQERRIQQEVRALFGAPAPNKEESGHRQ
jgi:hypothetical protein